MLRGLGVWSLGRVGSRVDHLVPVLFRNPLAKGPHSDVAVQRNRPGREGGREDVGTEREKRGMY